MADAHYQRYADFAMDDPFDDRGFHLNGGAAYRTLEAAPLSRLDRIARIRTGQGSTLTGRSAVVHKPRRKWFRSGSSSSSGGGGGGYEPSRERHASYKSPVGPLLSRRSGAEFLDSIERKYAGLEGGFSYDKLSSSATSVHSLDNERPSRSSARRSDAYESDPAARRGYSLDRQTAEGARFASLGSPVEGSYLDRARRVLSLDRRDRLNPSTTAEVETDSGRRSAGEVLSPNPLHLLDLEMSTRALLSPDLMVGVGHLPTRSGVRSPGPAVSPEVEQAETEEAVHVVHGVQGAVGAAGATPEFLTASPEPGGPPAADLYNTQLSEEKVQLPGLKRPGSADQRSPSHASSELSSSKSRESPAAGGSRYDSVRSPELGFEASMLYAETRQVEPASPPPDDDFLDGRQRQPSGGSFNDRNRLPERRPLDMRAAATGDGIRGGGSYDAMLDRQRLQVVEGVEEGQDRCLSPTLITGSAQAPAELLGYDKCLSYIEGTTTMSHFVAPTTAGAGGSDRHLQPFDSHQEEESGLEFRRAAMEPEEGAVHRNGNIAPPRRGEQLMMELEDSEDEALFDMEELEERRQAAAAAEMASRRRRDRRSSGRREQREIEVMINEERKREEEENRTTRDLQQGVDGRVTVDRHRLRSGEQGGPPAGSDAGGGAGGAGGGGGGGGPDRCISPSPPTTPTTRRPLPTEPVNTTGTTTLDASSLSNTSTSATTTAAATTVNTDSPGTTPTAAGTNKWSRSSLVKQTRPAEDESEPSGPGGFTCPWPKLRPVRRPNASQVVSSSSFDREADTAAGAAIRQHHQQQPETSATRPTPSQPPTTPKPSQTQPGQAGRKDSFPTDQPSPPYRRPSGPRTPATSRGAEQEALKVGPSRQSTTTTITTTTAAASATTGAAGSDGKREESIVESRIRRLSAEPVPQLPGNDWKQGLKSTSPAWQKPTGTGRGLSDGKGGGGGGGVSKLKACWEDIASKEKDSVKKALPRRSGGSTPSESGSVSSPPPSSVSSSVSAPPVFPRSPPASLPGDWDRPLRPANRWGQQQQAQQLQQQQQQQWRQQQQHQKHRQHQQQQHQQRKRQEPEDESGTDKSSRTPSKTTRGTRSDRASAAASSSSSSSAAGPTPNPTRTGSKPSKVAFIWPPPETSAKGRRSSWTLTSSTKGASEETYEGTGDDNSMTSRIKEERTSRSRYVREARPTFIIKPRRQFVDEGLAAKFKASFDGEPTPTLTWDKGGATIKNGGRYKMYEKNDFHFLEILDITSDDKGTYTATIVNSVGSANSSAELEVFCKPQIKSRRKTVPKVDRELKSLTVEDGATAVLACAISGNPEPTISWYHEGRQLKSSPEMKQTYDGKEAKLTFSEVFPEDNGTYECVASNTQGEVRSTATLTVKVPEPKAEPPGVTAELQDTSATEGDRITLECSFTGLPEPKVTWYKGSRQVRASTDVVLDYDGGVATLVIKESMVSDSGAYKCLAQNEAGMTDTRCALEVKKSRPASRVTAPVSKPSPATLPKSPPAEQENSLASRYKPTPSRTANSHLRSQHHKEEEVPPPVPKSLPPSAHKGSGSSTTTTTSTTSNITHNSASTSQARLTAPNFVRPLKSLNVLDGDRVQMEVEIEGSQPMEIIWLHKDKEIKKNSTVYQLFSEGRVHRLVIPEVYPEDAGLYICEAYNEAGDEDSTCTLTVEDPPCKDEMDNYNNNTTSISKQNNYQNSPAPKKPVSKPELIQEPEPMDGYRRSSTKVPKQTLPEPVYEEEPEFLAKPILKPTNRPAVAKMSDPEPEFLAKPVLKPSKRPVPNKIPEPEPEFLAKPILKPSKRPLPEKQSQPEWEFLAKPILKPSKKPLPGKIPDPEPEFLAKPILKPSTKPPSEPLPSPEPEFLQKSILKQTLPRVPPTAARLFAKQRSQENSASYSRYSQSDPQDADEEDEVEEAEELYQRKKKQNGIRPVSDSDLDDEPFVPEFVRKPKSVHVNEGNEALFACTVIGNPDPEILWKKDGVTLTHGGRFKIFSEGDNHTFEIAHTLATDAGRYVVEATNEEGTEKYSVSLMVKELDNSEVADFRSLLKSSSSGAKDISRRPQLKALGSAASTAEQIDFRNVLTRHVKTKQRPRVVRELSDVSVSEGQSAILTCKIVGVPDPRVSWFFNKRKEIKESRFFKMTYDGNVAKLVIAEVYPEDEGEYLVKAMNEAGFASTSCDLRVHHEGGLDTNSMEDEAAPPLPGNPPTTVLATPPPLAPAMQAPVQQAVMEPPFIEELSPDNIHVVIGGSFTLVARFVAEPTPVVKWTRDKRELRSGGRFRIETVRDYSSLVVSDVDVQDSGRYTVSVQNDLGLDSCDSSVTIEDCPDPPTGRPAASNISDTTLTLSWYGPSYDGGSVITNYKVEVSKYDPIQWNVLSTDCQYTSYHASGLEPNTEYIFRVCAGNKHGFSEPGKMSEVVTTCGKPRISLQIDEMTFEPRHVEIDPSRSFHDIYSLGEEIGRGRFGSVYTCTESSSQRVFAAKVIKVKASQRDEARQEIDVMNALHHPKLLLLWDAFESHRQMILVMEHVAGGELFERIIDDDYYLTERECVHFMRQICDGVAFMHSKGILHLDLKPENILCITPNSNEVKIIDFGLARRFEPEKNFRVMFGTPEFVAPEIVNYENIDFATDLWSVGVICYILLSGLSPFLGENEAETLVNVTMAQWDFEDETFDDITADAKNFIGGLLNKDMRKRMKSADCLSHSWLSQDVKFMRAKRLSTEKHKRFMARRKWQSGEYIADVCTDDQSKAHSEKTGNAIRALGRMASLQKQMAGLNLRSRSPAGTTSTSTPDAQSESSDQSSSTAAGGDVAVSSSFSGRKTTPPAPLPRTRSRLVQSANATPPTTTTAAATVAADTNLQSEGDSGIEASRGGADGSASDDDIRRTTPAVSRVTMTSVESGGGGGGGSRDSEGTTYRARSIASITLSSSRTPSGTSSTEKTRNAQSSSSRTARTREEPAAAAPPSSPPPPVPPSFVKEMRDFEVYEGDSARFDVVVASSSEPEVTWYKEDAKIVDSRRYVIDQQEDGTCSLIIKNCVQEDDATYSCGVRSAEGEASCSAELYVENTGFSSG